ncbi:uncharacterized protein LOC143588185, partial [Bidens hawaiensis]|uniref:uncharacterized protein LOC143588185 n=1 Tax=Bidens hawaiensis TaxID=980011 RepID=UPI00404A9F80
NYIVCGFRGWWTPIFLTAGISSAKYFFHDVMRKNTVTQARSNISRHYDLSNEVFSLFLDETMTYSCAIFKSEDEDLKTAQMRKISSLIEKVSICIVDHVEKIGTHYHPTLRYWRANFSKDQREFYDLMVGCLFIRTWEYYFDYCAAGFKIGVLMDYQVVFSRPENFKYASLGDPYKPVDPVY